MLSSNGNSDVLYSLISSIQAHTEFDHDVENFEVVETHISYILLTGPFAYKFKKPVDLGFLDFTRPERRKFFCEEELRLNKRLAPEIYLEVVSFTGHMEKPVINGDGPVLEYAVKMVQFAHRCHAEDLLKEGRLTQDHIDQLAQQLADFHNDVNIADDDSGYGTPDSICRDVMANFENLRPILKDDRKYLQNLDRLRLWTENTFNRLSGKFLDRKYNGCIRECHGDLHLGNIVLYNDRMLVFDCIEFSKSLHWIDVINDLAFLIMDLHEHGNAAMAHRLLNGYLQRTGDYEGLNVLKYYLVYRALVRSKVAGIRLGQSDLDEQGMDRETRTEHRYIDLALEFTQPVDPVMLITHGLSGSGKSMFSRSLADKLGAIWLRSDVERRRLHGLRWNERSGSGLRDEIYSMDSTVKTYQRLADLSKMILMAGYSVIVDATFLQKHSRETFHTIADESNSKFIILEFEADMDVLEKRIKQRTVIGTDVSEADLMVLDYQKKHQEPVDEFEARFCRRFDSTNGFGPEDVLDLIESLKEPEPARMNSDSSIH